MKFYLFDQNSRVSEITYEYSMAKDLLAIYLEGEVPERCIVYDLKSGVFLKNFRSEGTEYIYQDYKFEDNIVVSKEDENLKRSYEAYDITNAKLINTYDDPFPKVGRVVPESDRDDIREIIHGNYRIIYRLINDEAQILTGHHSARLLDLSEIDGT